MNTILKNTGTTVAVLALLLTIPLTTGLAQGEKRISAKNLPAAVRSAFAKSYPGARITGAAQETEKGVMYYEIESVDGKIHRDLLYTRDGQVSEIEEAMEPASLPEAVKATLKTKYPGYTVKKAEKTTHGTVTDLEVLIEMGKKRHEVVFDENGTVKKNEQLKAKAEKKGEKEENEDEEDEDDN